jgi:hypothetical protein
MRQKATDYLVHRTPAAVQSPARITAFLDKLDAFARAKEREPFDALEKLMFVNVCPRGEGSVIPVGLLCAALFFPKGFHCGGRSRPPPADSRSASWSSALVNKSCLNSCISCKLALISRRARPVAEAGPEQAEGGG